MGNEWLCPICGCDEFIEHYFDNEGESKLLLREDAEVAYCECAHCSIQFGNPNKFLSENIFGEELMEEANNIIRQVICGQ